MSMGAVSSLGASLGAKFALVYGLIFIVVAATRYGADLKAAPPDGNFWLAYAGGAVSLAVASLGITLIMAVVAAALGAVTAVCAAGLYRLVGKRNAGTHPVLISLGVAVTGVLVLHLALGQAGLWTLNSLHSTTYLFWLGIPSILFILAAVLAGRTCGREVPQQMSA